MGKLETIEGKTTNWNGLWWHPEYCGFSSAVISLAELKKFKGKVRLFVRKNKYFNGGINGRPNYVFCLKDSSADVFHNIEVEDDEEQYAKYDAENDVWRTNTGNRLYTYEEVRQVKYGACMDGKDGYDPGDLLVEDYV